MMEASVVEWCEAYTDKYTYSNYIAEISNTFSNLAFTIVALFSIYEFNQPLFRKCNITLFLVGIGSAVFHSTDTYIGQILDELPMSILTYYYVSIACHIKKWRFPRVIYISLATLAWSLYLTLRIYNIFISIFVIQLLIPILIIIVYTNKTNSQKRFLIAATLSAIIAKSCWIYERYLHATFHCPADLSDPLYYLHSYWHIGIAIAHYLLMKTMFINITQESLISNQI
jgi:hypothetical protein